MLYLACVEGCDELPGEGPWSETFTLRPGLFLVDSDQGCSVVYHALKDHAPRDTPLLVAALGEVPKFKRMAPGALAWARGRGSRRK